MYNREVICEELNGCPPPVWVVNENGVIQGVMKGHILTIAISTFSGLIDGDIRERRDVDDIAMMEIESIEMVDESVEVPSATIPSSV